jgi:hypothetical protein
MFKRNWRGKKRKKKKEELTRTPWSVIVVPWLPVILDSLPD